MESIIQKITDWLKELLIKGITDNLSGMFDTVNQRVGEISAQVGTTPSAWNGGVFSMIQTLSETVIIPIAGVVLTFIMCYELISMVIDRNNLHDVDSWMFFRWIFKTFCAVLIVTNTWDIIMGIFDVAQSVVNRAGGVISSSTNIDISSTIGSLSTKLEAMELGQLIGLYFQSMIVGLSMSILSVYIFVIVYGRMVEIYLTASLGPIPLATMVNREWGNIGQNYLKSLLALGFQAWAACKPSYPPRIPPRIEIFRPWRKRIPDWRIGWIAASTTLSGNIPAMMNTATPWMRSVITRMCLCRT